MRTPIKYLVKVLLLAVSVIMVLIGCQQDDPQREDTPELITKVILTFVPDGGGTTVVGTATDPDGDGVQNIAVDGPIGLSPNTTYVMTIQMVNSLVPAGQPGNDITTEVAEEGQEHQFFFAWTNAVFANPTGNGNLDGASDPVNYAGGPYSKDIGGLNLGITTSWTTVAASASGTFRLVLKHQPGTKTPVSDATIGETDLDITFPLNVQ